MNVILKLCIVGSLFFSCTDSKKGNATEPSEDSSLIVLNQTEEASNAIPFIGRKGFETRPAVSGTGTPHRYVEIMKNGDVFFGYEQENQADGTISKERYNAGKFSKYMKCFFKESEETFYYELTKDKIYEVDNNNVRLTGEDCCNSDNTEMENKCPCEGEYR